MNEIVRRLRKALGVSTKEFGAIFQVSGRTVEGWEQGRKISDEKCKLILDLKGKMA